MTTAANGRRAAAGTIVVALVSLGLVGCGDDSVERSDAAFCSAVDTLADDDPFAELETATPGEMQTAFDALAGGVDAIAAAAPAEVRVAADRYAEAVDAMVDELEAAGYDPRLLDPLGYQAAVVDYEAAAVSVENAADARCDPTA